MACAGFKLRAAGRTVLLVWTLVSALAVTTHAVTTTHYYFPTSTATDPTGGIWPTDVQWNALSNLQTDGVDSGITSENDFVGSIASPAGSWYNGANHLFFRMQVRYNTALTTTYATPFGNDVFYVIIDKAGAGGRIDYAFTWDVQNSTSRIEPHGLELSVPNGTFTDTSLWSAVDFNDRDGLTGSRGAPDFNAVDGSWSSTGTDGYVRAVHNSDTSSTFVDFAISWGYLTSPYGGSTVTTLTRNDTLYVAMASRHVDTEGENDHSSFGGSRGISDIIGASTTNTLATGFSGAINPVPEPGMAMLAFCAAGLLAARRSPRRRRANP